MEGLGRADDESAGWFVERGQSTDVKLNESALEHPVLLLCAGGPSRRTACEVRQSPVIRVCVWRVRRRVLSVVVGSNSEPIVN